MIKILWINENQNRVGFDWICWEGAVKNWTNEIEKIKYAQRYQNGQIQADSLLTEATFQFSGNACQKEKQF